MIWERYPWPTDLNRLLDGNSSEMALEGQPITRLREPLAPRSDSFLNKTGSTNGFGAYVVLVPGEELGVVVLANRNYPNTERVKAASRLIELLTQPSTH
jgi:beta-lactamase class C